MNSLGITFQTLTAADAMALAGNPDRVLVSKGSYGKVKWYRVHRKGGALCYRWGTLTSARVCYSGSDVLSIVFSTN